MTTDSVLGIISNAVLTLTLMVMWFQMVLMRKTLRQAENEFLHQSRGAHEQMLVMDAARRSQNALEIAKLLSSPTNLASRRRVVRLQGLPYSQWSEEDKTRVDDVIHYYNIAIAMESLDLLPPEFIAQQYGRSILRVWRVGKDYVADYRREAGQEESEPLELYAEKLLATMAGPGQSRSGTAAQGQ